MGILVSTLSSHWRILQPSKPRTLDRIRPPASEPEDFKTFIQPRISSFAGGIGYAPPSTTSNDALWKAMCLCADQTGVPYEEGTHSWVCFKVGYGYPVVCFPHHPFEVQVFVGIHSGLGLLLDDEAVNYLQEFQMFHERFAAGEKQPIPLLQGWVDLMKLAFKYWDPLVANFIVSSSLSFLNANVLEARKVFSHIERTKAGHGWAWFLREKDGVGAAFYKEELAGEKHNYIHNRRWYEDKEARTVFAEISEEVRMKTQEIKSQHGFPSSLFISSSIRDQLYACHRY
ncbi:hypothetical protein CSAL01_08678 [Colletotrichum salicis]|uniref:Uncharacterized protein n=1 Tax=Colletotrichum salicis TaxID=1209931 RepID=A0A135SFK5_9PEZI|nr:hypothetical protein CSAL01_08678 [Colletotrichum salicis]